MRYSYLFIAVLFCVSFFYLNDFAIHTDNATFTWTFLIGLLCGAIMHKLIDLTITNAPTKQAFGLVDSKANEKEDGYESPAFAMNTKEVNDEKIYNNPGIQGTWENR